MSTMSERNSLRVQILTDFEERVNRSEDVPEEVAELFTGEHTAETFGDDEELLDAIEERLRNGDDQ